MVTETHAIYQIKQQTSHKNVEAEPIQPVLINIYENNTYR